MADQFKNEPLWLQGNTVVEAEFVEDYLAASGPLYCVNGVLYTQSGEVMADGKVLADIQRRLEPYCANRLARTAGEILAALKSHCFYEPSEPDPDVVNVANGSLNLKTGTFTPGGEFSFYRLHGVSYDPDAPEPKMFLRYIHELYNDYDLPTVQEFHGYVCIPSTAAQIMLVVIGNGGEGKTVEGAIYGAMFGSSAVFGSLHSTVTGNFGLAALENRQLFIDDDLDGAGLERSNTLKSIVTAKTPLAINQKYQAVHQARMYTRLLCYGNTMPPALHDHSDGFWRRQIILRTKPKDPFRVDDPELAQKIIRDELPGILNWSIEGLRRLRANNYRFTLSPAAQKLKEEARLDAFSPERFMQDDEAVIFESGAGVTSADLYGAYRSWALANAEQVVARKTFVGWLNENAYKYHITPSNHVLSETGARVRGFFGLRLNRFRPSYGVPLELAE